MELNTAKRFPLLDADVANSFIHLSSMRYYRQGRRRYKSETTTCISEGFLFLYNQGKIVANVY